MDTEVITETMTVQFLVAEAKTAVMQHIYLNINME